MMNSPLKVSVCVPTYNRSHYLPATLESILNQSFTDFELIICDDCSTDKTAQVVGNFDDPRIRYTRNERNLGIPGNLNRCVELARGDYIAIYHDHDLYHPTILEESVGLLDRYPNMAYVATGCAFIDQDGHVLLSMPGSFPLCTPPPGMAVAILSGLDCPVAAWSLVRRRCYELEGTYDPSAGFLADVDLWIRLGAKYEVGFIAKPMVQVRTREDGRPYAGTLWDRELLNYQIRMRNLARVWPPGSMPYHKQRLRLALMLRLRLLRAVAVVLARADHAAIGEGVTTLNGQGPRPVWLLLKLAQSYPMLTRLVSGILAVSRSRRCTHVADSEA